MELEGVEASRKSMPPFEKVITIAILFIILVVLLVYKSNILERAVSSPISTVMNRTIGIQSSYNAITNVVNKTYQSTGFSAIYNGEISLNVSGVRYSIPMNFNLSKKDNMYRIDYTFNFSGIHSLSTFSSFSSNSTGFLFSNSTGFVSCVENKSFECEYIPLAVQPELSFGTLLYFFTVNPEAKAVLSLSPYNFENMLSMSNGLALKFVSYENRSGTNCSLMDVYEENGSVPVGETCLSKSLGLPVYANLTFASTGGIVESFSIDFSALLSPPNALENISFIPKNSTIIVK